MTEQNINSVLGLLRPGQIDAAAIKKHLVQGAKIGVYEPETAAEIAQAIASKLKGVKPGDETAAAQLLEKQVRSGIARTTQKKKK